MFGVMERDIIAKDLLTIEAKRVFAMQPSQAQVRGLRGETIDVAVVVYDNVIINYDFICDLREDSPFYKGIMDGLKKEQGKEVKQ